MSRNKKGLNFVIIDSNTNKVIDSVNFDITEKMLQECVSCYILKRSPSFVRGFFSTLFEPTSLQWYNKQDWSESMTDIIAHRGSKGTHPENTCIAFREAVRVGAEGIELDVHLSKDGYLIVMHDETVDRTTDGHGEIQQLTLNELKQLDAGSWFQKNPSVQCVPTLEDVLNCLVEQFNGFEY